MWPFSEDLKSVLRTRCHDLEHLLDECERNILLEQIAHRVNEDQAWRSPSKRNGQRIVMESQLEAVAVVRFPHRLKPYRHPLGVTIFAARADLCAPRHRVPRCLGPLD